MPRRVSLFALLRAVLRLGVAAVGHDAASPHRRRQVVCRLRRAAQIFVAVPCRRRRAILNLRVSQHDDGTGLVLGLKGTISELELHTIRSRLTAGLLAKA